jgi:hypothetical protein
MQEWGHVRRDVDSQPGVIRITAIPKALESLGLSPSRNEPPGCSQVLFFGTFEVTPVHGHAAALSDASAAEVE